MAARHPEVRRPGFPYSEDSLPEISILSEDVLEEIFYQFSRSSPRGSPGLESLTVTHVCRFWRVVAMSSARLWSNIALHLPEVAKHHLRHSKGAPLRLFWNERFLIGSEHDTSPSANAWIFPHAARVRNIHFEGLLKVQFESFMSGISGDLPALQELELILALERPLHMGLNLAIRAPCLRTVFLSLATTEARSIVQLLKGAPLLEAFHIHSSTLLPSTESPDTRVLDVRHIRDWTFVSTTGVDVLLNALDICPANLCLSGFPATVNLEKSLTPETKARLKHTTHFTHMSISAGMGLAVHTEDKMSTYQFQPSGPHALVLIECLMTYGLIFDWSSITHLEINPDRTIRTKPSISPGAQRPRYQWHRLLANAWPSMLQCLPSLHHVSVFDFPLDGFRSQLSQTIHGEVPAPWLETVEVVDLHLSDSSPPLEIPDREALFMLLRERQRIQKPLKRLILRRCQGAEDFVCQVARRLTNPVSIIVQ